jgi:hypothetical protein
LAKDSVYKDKSSVKISRKKENTLDYYISKVSAGESGVNWWSESEEKTDRGSESKKHEFLKKNIKPTSVIPSHTEKKRSIPNNMGYFETNFGTMQVGYKKYKRDSDIAFSLVPDSVKEIGNIPEKKLKDPNNYFGGETQSRDKRFRSGRISFKYNPKDKEIKKLEEDRDGIADEEDKLLYQDKKEDESLEELESARNVEGADKRNLDKRIAKIRDVKEEKEEDNLAFLKIIDNFIDNMKKNKLKKLVDSDDVIMRRKRIIELSSNPDLSDLSLEELKELLKELLKKEEHQKLPDEFSQIDFEKLTKNRLQELIQKLISGLPGGEISS